MNRLLALETRRLWRDPAARWLCAFLVLACTLAVIQGSSALQRAKETHTLALQSAQAVSAGLRSRLAANEPRDVAVIMPFRVQLPVPAGVPVLGDFSSGLLAASPGSASIGLRSRADNLYSNTATDNPELSLRGSFDLSFVASVLAPLALIALCYNLYADDRDRGTARLLLAQGGTPVRSLLIRSAPRLILVMAPLLLSALALLLLNPGAPGRGLAALNWLLLALAHLGVWWAAILLVNSARLSSESAALALITLWVILTLLVPVALAAGARVAHPPPSRFEQLATARAAEVRAMAEWDNDHPELVSGEFEERLASLRKSLSVTKRVTAAVAPVNALFASQLASQQAIIEKLAWLSPVLAVQNAMAEVAGTGSARDQAFQRATEAYLTDVKAHLGAFIERGDVMTASDLDALPRFNWHAPEARPGPAILYFIVLALALGLSGGRRLQQEPR